MLMNKSKTYAVIGLVTAAALILGLYLQNSSKSEQHASANPESATAVSDTCAAKNTITYTCYKKELTNIVEQSGPEAATALIKTQYSKVPYVKSQCHQLIHVVGRAALAKYGTVADTFAHGDQFCWSGYYHGAMEEIAILHGSNYIVDNANTLCEPIAKAKGQYSFYHFNCVHGMGHGFMEALNNNLFTSLAACDKMTDDWNRESCYGGVFMQNIMNVQSPDETVDHKSAYLKDDQPMYPCTAVDEQYKNQCYLMQTSYALQVENYDFSKVFALCKDTEQTYRTTCYQSLGRDASGQSISDVDKTNATCLSGSDYEAQSNCIIGASKDFVSYFHSDKQAKQLCASLPPDLQSICTSTVTSYYSTF
jgi:hypothetical protein